MDTTSAGYIIIDFQVSEYPVVPSDRDDELCGAVSLIVDSVGMRWS